MVRYFNSPLKVTGTILILAGTAFILTSFQHSFYLGISVLFLGVMVIVTELFMNQMKVNTRDKITFEFVLILLIFCFAILLALDYYGIITLQNIFATIETLVQRGGLTQA